MSGWDNIPNKTNTKNSWDAIPNEESNWDAIPNVQTSESGSQWSELPKNVVPSGVQFLKDLVTPFIHPIQTATGIGKLATGMVEKLVPGQQDNEKIADAVIDFYVERYGSLENLKQTVIKDPVGFSGDLATVLTGVGGLGKTAVKSGSVASKVFGAVERGGKALMPTTAIEKGVINPAIQGVQQLSARGLGVSTGRGTQAFLSSAKGTKAFREGLHGAETAEDILEQSKSALRVMNRHERAAYLNEFRKIKNMPQSIDISPVQRELNKLMKNYNIKSVGGQLDFSRAPFAKKFQPEVEEIIEMVRDWGLTPGDRTPRMVDTLKRRLGDFYSESKNSRQFVEALYDKTNNVLQQNIPNYTQMTSQYAKFSKLNKEIEKGLSLGTKASSDTAIKKLMSTMKEDQQFRRNLMRQLEEVGGNELLDKIAGISLQQWEPSGLIGRSMLAGDVVSVIAGANPAILAGIALTSPRLMAEFTNTLGRLINEARKVPIGAKMGVYQAGKQGQALSPNALQFLEE